MSTTQALVGTTLLAVAFALGLWGAPGRAIATFVLWTVENGWVVLSGPIGEAIRFALA